MRQYRRDLVRFKISYQFVLFIKINTVHYMGQNPLYAPLYLTMRRSVRLSFFRFLFFYIMHSQAKINNWKHYEHSTEKIQNMLKKSTPILSKKSQPFLKVFVFILKNPRLWATSEKIISRSWFGVHTYTLQWALRKTNKQCKLVEGLRMGSVWKEGDVSTHVSFKRWRA